MGKKKVYDISVADCSHYLLENGVVSHNTGIYYSSDDIWIIGRQQEKDGTEVVGYNFVINIEKSRTTREKSKIPITVTHKGGISRWSGLMDMALESGNVIKPSNGWYQKVDKITGEVDEKKYRMADTDNREFWDSILKCDYFAKWVEAKYKISNGAILTDEDIDATMDELED